MYRIFEGLTKDQLEELENLSSAFEYTEEDLQYATGSDPVWDYRQYLFQEAASILFKEFEFEFSTHTYKSGELFYQCYGKLTYHNGMRAGTHGESKQSFWAALSRAIANQAAAAIEPSSDD